jgi:hypothetical protein
MVRCGNSFAPMTELNLPGPGRGQIFVVPLAYRYEVPFNHDGSGAGGRWVPYRGSFCCL